MSAHDRIRLITSPDRGAIDDRSVHGVAVKSRKLDAARLRGLENARMKKSGPVTIKKFSFQS